ncbi:MAG: hypothetical protein IJX26_00110 [Clostridia bacterium]|nr:hypothetical protein [Clostridia bacterium]
MKEIKFNNETYKIEFYNQFNGLIQIFNNKDKYLYKFKENFGLDYYIKTICDKQFLFVKIFNDNKQIYFIFDKSKLIFSGDVKEINITLEKLIIMRNDINCFGQKRVVEINIKEDKLEEYLIYYDERKHLENINFLYLFLDAIKVKNYDSCCCYLSNELKAIDKDSLFGYFDDFDDYLFIEDACLLKKNNEVIKIVHL